MCREFDSSRATWHASFVAQRTEAHVPVLAREVCEALAPALAGPEAVYVDATCGLGGHARAIIERFSPGRAVLFDRDAAALQRARERLGGLPCAMEFVHAPFSTSAQHLARLGVRQVAAILADLGVSSLQLDTPQRGFSFQQDGPLDMRMDPSRGQSAAEVLGSIDEQELTRALRDFGEEPDARRIARAIVDAKPRTTGALAQVVTAAMSAPQRRRLGRRIHPATRTFQAVRILVNGELDELDRLLIDAPPMLATHGRLAIITFHSLEDRRVKRAFRELARGPELPPGVPIEAKDLPRSPFEIPPGTASGMGPSAEEIDTNPRARSARLRVLRRTEEPLPKEPR